MLLNDNVAAVDVR